MTNHLRVTWGRRIRELRTERGLSLNRVAREAEIDQSNLWKVENGQAGLGDEARIRLATALQVQVADIFEYPDTRQGVTK